MIMDISSTFIAQKGNYRDLIAFQKAMLPGQVFTN